MGAVEALDGLGPVGREHHVEAFTLERDRERVAVRLLVVDDEDGRPPGHEASCISSFGNSA